MNVMNSLINQCDTSCSPVVKGCYEPTMKERLTERKQRLEQELAQVNAGLDVLNNDVKLATQLETLLTAIRS